MRLQYVDLHSNLDLILPMEYLASYMRMAATGCKLIVQPVSCIAERTDKKRIDRRHSIGSQALLERLLYVEPARASASGIRHLTCLSLPQPAMIPDDRQRHHLDSLTTLLRHPHVVAVGAELPIAVDGSVHPRTIEALQVIACATQVVLIDLPSHVCGRREIEPMLNRLLDCSGLDASRILINGGDEIMALPILERGMWCGLNVGNRRRMCDERNIDLLERYGAARFCVTSSTPEHADGPSPIPNFVRAMRRRGHSDELIREVIYNNPLEFLKGARKNISLC